MKLKFTFCKPDIAVIDAFDNATLLISEGKCDESEDEKIDVLAAGLS